MEKLLYNNKLYVCHEYLLEKDFESAVIEQAPHIFGENSIYIDIKKQIGESIITIPDGYLIDFSLEVEPRLHIIENELSSHDPYKHIGSQLLKFAISYKASGRKIKEFLLDALMKDESMRGRVEAGFLRAGYRNIDAFLESLIFEKPLNAVVVIDQSSPELENVLGQLTLNTDIVEFKTFKYRNDYIHQFTPFNAEVRDVIEKGRILKPETLNTVVVPAREEGFEKEFLGNNRWYAIRISASMIDRLKYIAIYQVSPVSAITCYAEIVSMEKYQDTNKYLVYVKNLKKIKPIPLDANNKRLALQAPRYTAIDQLLKAKKLSQVFC